MRKTLLFAIALLAAGCESPLRTIPPLPIPAHLIEPDPVIGPLVMDGFDVIGFLEPYSPEDTWSYAPLIRVTETSGHAVTVTRVELTMLDAGVKGHCKTTKFVGASASRDLFARSDRAYEVSFEGAAAPSGTDAAIVVDYFVNETGATYQVRASTRARPGPYPKDGIRQTSEPCTRGF